MPKENEREIKLLGEAIANTDREIFQGAVTGNDDEDIAHDESGDRTREDMGDGLEGQVEAEDDDADASTDADADADASDKDGDKDADAEDEAEGDAGDGEDKDAEKPPRDKEGKFTPKDGDKDGKDKAEGEDKSLDKGRVPSARLREETQRRQAAERERDELKARFEAGQSEFRQLSSRLDQALGKIDEISRRTTAAPAQQTETKAAEAPDLFTDPAAFIAHMQKPLLDKIEKLSQTREVDRAELSMRTARAEHKDVFDKAYEALGKLNPNDPAQHAIGARIARSADPGQALVDWYKKDQVLKEVGDDPAVYREKIAKETRDALMKDADFRKSLIEELRGEASTGRQGRPNTITRLPKSLSDAAGGRSAQSGEPFDDSDRGLFESVMAE